MAGAALLERLNLPRAPIVWRVATVGETIEETPSARSIVFDVPDWPGHLAGQHVDLRLTAEDGYQTERSYSIASPPEEPAVVLTIERIDDGEVSPYLVDEVRTGDQLELRGPVGGYFTWRLQDGGPLLLLAGGSGLVPLMAMLRHRAANHSMVDTRMLVSAKRLDDILYRDELSRLADGDGLELRYTLTRSAPPGWSGLTGRVDMDMLARLGPTPAERPRTFVCGPTGFVESVADQLVKLGHDPISIHAERFGPTGG
jgi:ferredoxin-NADP reductase